MMNMNHIYLYCYRNVTCLFLLISFFVGCQPEKKGSVPVEKNMHIGMIGGNLGSWMMYYSHFETGMHMRFPKDSLFIRNMCDTRKSSSCGPLGSCTSAWAVA